ncbi:MAG: hypothetical protein LQ348_000408 [Seirophora lacunosa]|nr:MAG: hypothetical protein LQ348_000408 [Seirophora lacunosa]
MPRAVFPPTPASSMDLVGKESISRLPLKDKALFTLPPPAIPPSPSCDAPAEDEGRRQPDSEYSLPPPPTRTRKIIQMTPKMGYKADAACPTTAITPAKPRSTPTSKATGKKQPSSTSQAGKRIARKTAHSVIERRRRSKMNEEFGVLKNMIPACKDQDMHKLAILQSSIEYLRYLEQCVTDLKAANGLKSGSVAQRSPPPLQQTNPAQRHPHGENDEDEDDDDDEEDEDDQDDTDVDMIGTPGLPPHQTNAQQQAQAYTSPYSEATSPALDALYQKPKSFNSPLSGLPSPVIGPPYSTNRSYFQQSASSSSTSPTLVPDSYEGAREEATAALLMLNKDRRNTNSSGSGSAGRGMSVRDLLSS